MIRKHLWGIHYERDAVGYELIIGIPLFIFWGQYFDNWQVKRGLRAIRLTFYLAICSKKSKACHETVCDISLWPVPVGHQEIVFSLYPLVHKQLVTIGDLLSCYKDTSQADSNCIAWLPIRTQTLRPVVLWREESQ